eukprot:g1230.t1
MKQPFGFRDEAMSDNANIEIVNSNTAFKGSYVHTLSLIVQELRQRNISKATKLMESTLQKCYIENENGWTDALMNEELCLLCITYANKILFSEGGVSNTENVQSALELLKEAGMLSDLRLFFVKTQTFPPSFGVSSHAVKARNFVNYLSLRALALRNLAAVYQRIEETNVAAAMLDKALHAECDIFSIRSSLNKTHKHRRNEIDVWSLDPHLHSQNIGTEVSIVRSLLTLCNLKSSLKQHVAALEYCNRGLAILENKTRNVGTKIWKLFFYSTSALRGYGDTMQKKISLEREVNRIFQNCLESDIELLIIAMHNKAVQLEYRDHLSNDASVEIFLKCLLLAMYYLGRQHIVTRATKTSYEDSIKKSQKQDSWPDYVQLERMIWDKKVIVDKWNISHFGDVVNADESLRHSPKSRGRRDRKPKTTYASIYKTSGITITSPVPLSAKKKKKKKKRTSPRTKQSTTSRTVQQQYYGQKYRVYIPDKKRIHKMRSPRAPSPSKRARPKSARVKRATYKSIGATNRKLHRRKRPQSAHQQPYSISPKLQSPMGDHDKQRLRDLYPSPLEMNISNPTDYKNVGLMLERKDHNKGNQSYIVEHSRAKRSPLDYEKIRAKWDRLVHLRGYKEACLIQSHFRAFQARKQLQTKIAERQEEEVKVLLIQKHFRGHAARNKVEAMKLEEKEKVAPVRVFVEGVNEGVVKDEEESTQENLAQRKEDVAETKEDKAEKKEDVAEKKEDVAEKKEDVAEEIEVVDTKEVTPVPLKDNIVSTARKSLTENIITHTLERACEFEVAIEIENTQNAVHSLVDTTADELVAEAIQHNLPKK